jgi:hypothetical protein
LTRSIDLIKRELEKASQQLEILETEMKSLDTKDRYKCRDALHGLHKAAELIRDEAEELLTFDFKP